MPQVREIVNHVNVRNKIDHVAASMAKKDSRFFSFVGRVIAHYSANHGSESLELLETLPHIDQEKIILSYVVDRAHLIMKELDLEDTTIIFAFVDHKPVTVQGTFARSGNNLTTLEWKYWSGMVDNAADLLSRHEEGKIDLEAEELARHTKILQLQNKHFSPYGLFPIQRLYYHE
jgi:hypothetical protein